MMNETELLARAKFGNGLLPKEMSWIAKELEAPKPGAKIYTFLHILGLTGSTQYRNLVEKYLDYDSDADSLIASMALKVLCEYWNMAEAYIDVLLKVINVQPEESERMSYALHMAMSIAGEFLRDHDSASLLEALLRRVEDTAFDDLTREIAYSSLLRAGGRSWRDITSTEDGGARSAETEHDVIEAAKERLANMRTS